MYCLNGEANEFEYSLFQYSTHRLKLTLPQLVDTCVSNQCVLNNIICHIPRQYLEWIDAAP